jgi:hypothetical protein
LVSATFETVSGDRTCERIDDLADRVFRSQPQSGGMPLATGVSRWLWKGHASIAYGTHLARRRIHRLTSLSEYSVLAAARRQIQ